MIGAGTSKSIDSKTVQRPSPESATQGLISSSFASSCNALAARSSSHVPSLRLQGHEIAVSVGVQRGVAAGDSFGEYLVPTYRYM